MALSFDTANLVIESTASILDLPAFHAALRDWEDSEVAAPLPVTHTWKALDLGGGAFMYQADLINGWTLKFPSAGNYVIQGNLNGTIVPVAGVYVERKTSAAYATTAIGGSGPSAGDIALSLRIALAAELAAILRSEKFMRNKQILNPATGKRTVYEDDGSTVLGEGDAFMDVAGTQPYDGTGPVHRTERLA